MATVIIHHQVTDYDSWRRVFDSAQTLRREEGEQSAEVFRDANDPNRVSVITQYSSLDAARSYFESDKLKAKMAEAGVAGKPELHFLQGT
jgi:quinol monooxygenase YgiN